MNHFLFPYTGNKRQEVEYILPHIDLKKFKRVVEPFCGSSAISYAIYKHIKDPTKVIEFVLCDNDEQLISFYNSIKNGSIFKLIEEINEEIVPEIQMKKKVYEDLIKEKTEKAFIVKNKFYNIRPGMYPTGKEIKPIKLSWKQKEFIEFIRKDYVTIVKSDWKDTYLKYKDDPETLIIMDPPYLQTCNSFYSEDHSLDIYQYFHVQKHLQTIGEPFHKCGLMFILEDMWIIRLLFGDQCLGTYDKLYQTSKKKTRHIIYGFNMI